MGHVYRARQVALGRAVALKVIRPEVAGDLSSERFQREKKLLCELNHPGVVKILDAGIGEHGPYLVMELLDGPSLADLIRGDPDAARRQAEALLLQLLSALGHVHERGLVHRDVKPPNLMLTQAGELKLVDFGLAVSESPDRTVLTQEHAAVGTPAYFAPELFAGAPASPRTDVWAAGCVYYELLAGHPPFRAGNLPDLYHKVNSTRPPPIPAVEPALDRKRAALLELLLAKDPDRRPADGDAAAAALRAALEPEARAPLDFSGAITRPRPGTCPPTLVIATRRPGMPMVPLVLAFAALLALALVRPHAPRAAGLPSARPALVPLDLDAALVRFRPRQMLEDTDADLRAARARPAGMNRELAAARSRIEARMRGALDGTDLAAALGGAAPWDPELSGAGERGQRRYRALTDLTQLAATLADERIPVKLPAPRGWPHDLAPLPGGPAPPVEGVVLAFADKEELAWTPFPVDGPTLRSEDASALALSLPNAISREVAPRAWSSRPAARRYVHPVPLPLREAAPGEDVALSVVVRDLQPDEQLAVQLTTPGGGATEPVVINGGDHHRWRYFHAIPAAFLRHRTIALEYVRCAGPLFEASCEVLEVDVLYLRRPALR